MKLWFLLIAGLNLCAGDMTIYHGHVGGVGRFTRLNLYIDGRMIGKIKPMERITLQLPDGKHTFRLGEELVFSVVFEVKGTQILRVGSGGLGPIWLENLLSDPLLKEEFDKTVPIKKEELNK